MEAWRRSQTKPELLIAGFFKVNQPCLAVASSQQRKLMLYIKYLNLLYGRGDQKKRTDHDQPLDDIESAAKKLP